MSVSTIDDSRDEIFGKIVMFVELHEIYCQRARIYTKLLCLIQYQLLNCQWTFTLVMFP
jgi:hypothetical protein